MIHNVGRENSIVQELVADLRDTTNHGSRFQFRTRVETLGFLLGYELSKTLDYKPVSVQTPLGTASGQRLLNQPVVGTVLRAGLPLHAGLLKAFPEADNCFVGAYRSHDSSGAFEIKLDYFAAPDLADRTLILVDPMLATGASAILTMQSILKQTTPARTLLVSIIASEPGITRVQKALPEVEIWTAAVDSTLNERGYIVPGLGDAGDLCFGETAPR
jgi:uracil phosphoribosyltransferase